MNNIKQYIIDVLIINGITLILKMFWDGLEIVLDGGIQESCSDTVIAFILVLILWKEIRKWVTVRTTGTIQDKIKRLP